MDYIYSEETQAGIDDYLSLFSPEVEELEELKEEVAHEEYNIESDTEIQGLIGGLFTETKPDPVSEIVEEVETKVSNHRISLSDENDPFSHAFNVLDALIDINAYGEKKKLKEEVLEEPEEKLDPYMAGLVNGLSQFTKNNKQGEENLTSNDLVEQKLQNMQRQLDRIRGMMLEGTMVSGIGQGGDGQTPGSGEVRVLKMDDVLHGNSITDGDVLVWDEVQGGFIPVSGGGLGRIVDGDPITGEPETTRSVLLEKAAPKMIQLADARMGRNELWPSQMLTQEDANEGFASFILELDRLKPTMYVGDNAPLDPSLGDLWFDATLLEMRMWYNDPDHPSEDLKWISVMAPGNSGVAAVSDSPPENPSVGQTWFDSHMLELRVWYVPRH